jgi:thymidylate synthase
MNTLDKQYTALLQDILDNGVTKQTRNGDTLSVFGRQIRHSMKAGFPLLTTKKMAFKTMVTELLWFLRGDTSIKYLLENDCNIWNGDAYKNYEKWWKSYSPGGAPIPLSKEEFINRIKTDDEFAKKWGELGPVYGKQWRDWEVNESKEILRTENVTWPYEPNPHTYQQRVGTFKFKQIDQIANLINDLKTNPDSRRLMVNAWNVGELDQCVLPPCHYGFQVYTRELSLDERLDLMRRRTRDGTVDYDNRHHGFLDYHNIPKRAISLMFNMRSTDVGLGLSFNLGSYGLLLTILSKIVNMVPDELIYNGGDVHLYSNHIEPIKEQLNRKPYELPTLNIMKTDDFWKNFDVSLFNHLDVNDFVIENYKSHPPIKLILSN